jgi:hypothetical protein
VPVRIGVEPVAGPPGDDRIPDLRAHRDAVADVEGAFENGGVIANVCAFTWFCTSFDTHPNVTGYGVIAHAFLDVLQP